MFPAINSQQRLSLDKKSKSSKKVPLTPGHSLMDWIRLTKSGVDLKGTGPRFLTITSEELAKHNKPDNLWMAIRGLVFNVTKYLEYHPGGADELMRGAGKDATSLFEEVHRWVNYESMLKECLVGRLADEVKLIRPKMSPAKNMLAPPTPSTASLNPLGRNTLPVANGQPLQKAVIPQITLEECVSDTAALQNTVVLKASSQELSHDWYQDNDDVIFVIHSKQRIVGKEQIICDIEGKRLCVDLIIDSKMWTFHCKLTEGVDGRPGVTVLNHTKVEIRLRKHEPGVIWDNFGLVQKTASIYSTRNVNNLRYSECEIIEKTAVTHDTSFYHLKLPRSRWMSVPIGRHVYLKANWNGVELCKPYTAVLPSLLCEDSEKAFLGGEDLYFLIKHYDTGALTSVFNSLSVGDAISVSTWDGDFNPERTKKFKNFVMLAAGTGFTPMVRVLRHLLDRDNESKVRLLFFNKQKRDIMWNQELEDTQKKYNQRFSLVNVLSQEDDAYDGPRGQLSKQLLKNLLPDLTESREIFFFACGPTLFTKLAIDLVQALGYLYMHAFT